MALILSIFRAIWTSLFSDSIAVKRPWPRFKRCWGFPSRKSHYRSKNYVAESTGEAYCLNLLAGWGLRLEIKKEFLPPGCEALFPIDNALFGAGRAVELNYKDFTPEKRRPYLDCVKAIYKAYEYKG